GIASFGAQTGVDVLSSAGGRDIFVLKLDATGGLVWAKSVGASGEDRGIGVHVDDAGHLYLVGDFAGTVDFDPSSGVYNLTSAGDRDAFVSKMDSEGNLIWARRLGG